MSDKYCVIQDDLKDCGVCALLSIIKYYGGYVTKEYLREITKTDQKGVSALNLIRASRTLGFESFGLKSNIKKLKENMLPLIAHIVVDKKYPHFVVIYKIEFDKKIILLMDPSKGYIKMSFTDFEKKSTGYFLLLKPKQKIIKLDEKSNKITIGNFIRKYRLVIISIIFMSFIFIILNILTSFNFKFFYDEIDIMKNSEYKLIFFTLFSFELIKYIISFQRNYIIQKLNIILDKTIVKKTFYHIINLPYLYFKNHTNGDLVKRINDLGNIKDLISNLFVSILVDLFLALIILVIIFNINYSLSIVILLMLIVYSLIIVITNLSIKKKVREVYQYTGELNNYLIEALASFESIKNLSLQNYISNRFNNKYDEYMKINDYLERKINVELFFKNLILAIGNLWVLYLGIMKIKEGIISITLLISFLSLSNYLIEPIKHLLDLHFLLLQSKESFSRIKELLAIPTEKSIINSNTKIASLEGRIDIYNLSYSYNGIDNVFTSFSLNIKEGEKVLIHGDSGCGKSTLMALMNKYLDDGYKGDIFIGGYDLKKLDLSTIRQNICYISQNEYLYTDSVYENITLGRKIKYVNYLELCKNLLIDEIVQKSSLGYDYLIENNGENLSGGERDRIILARGILKKANIYILDETFKGLDINKERTILNYLFTNFKEKTFIIISHRKSNIDLFDNVINLGRSDNSA